jgi:cytochrome b subunit of formate dehydrogenase
MQAVRPTERLVRHRLPDRVFHWIMAATVLALLATGFLPIVGVKFPWVTIHWSAGLALTVAVLFHVVRAVFGLQPSTMVIRGYDLRDAWRGAACALGLSRAAPGKPGKYPLLQKLFHHTVALVLLTTIGTGLLMMVKVDTPFWTRDPYWLADRTWGIVYVLHGIAALASVTLVMVHVYFAVRPEKLWMTRSMILGWINRRDYQAHHDPARWAVADTAAGVDETAGARPSGLAD